MARILIIYTFLVTTASRTIASEYARTSNSYREKQTGAGPSRVWGLDLDDTYTIPYITTESPQYITNVTNTSSRDETKKLSINYFSTSTNNLNVTDIEEEQTNGRWVTITKPDKKADSPQVKRDNKSQLIAKYSTQLNSQSINVNNSSKISMINMKSESNKVKNSDMNSESIKVNYDLKDSIKTDLNISITNLKTKSKKVDNIGNSVRDEDGESIKVDNDFKNSIKNVNDVSANSSFFSNEPDNLMSINSATTDINLDLSSANNELSSITTVSWLEGSSNKSLKYEKISNTVNELMTENTISYEISTDPKTTILDDSVETESISPSINQGDDVQGSTLTTNNISNPQTSITFPNTFDRSNPKYLNTVPINCTKVINKEGTIPMKNNSDLEQSILSKSKVNDFYSNYNSTKTNNSPNSSTPINEFSHFVTITNDNRIATSESEFRVSEALTLKRNNSILGNNKEENEETWDNNRKHHKKESIMQDKLSYISVTNDSLIKDNLNTISESTSGYTERISKLEANSPKTDYIKTTRFKMSSRPMDKHSPSITDFSNSVTTYKSIMILPNNIKLQHTTKKINETEYNTNSGNDSVVGYFSQPITNIKSLFVSLPDINEVTHSAPSITDASDSIASNEIRYLPNESAASSLSAPVTSMESIESLSEINKSQYSQSEINSVVESSSESVTSSELFAPSSDINQLPYSMSRINKKENQPSNDPATGYFSEPVTPDESMEPLTEINKSQYSASKINAKERTVFSNNSLLGNSSESIISDESIMPLSDSNQLPFSMPRINKKENQSSNDSAVGYLSKSATSNESIVSLHDNNQLLFSMTEINLMDNQTSNHVVGGYFSDLITTGKSKESLPEINKLQYSTAIINKIQYTVSPNESVVSYLSPIAASTESVALLSDNNELQNGMLKTGPTKDIRNLSGTSTDKYKMNREINDSKFINTSQIYQGFQTDEGIDILKNDETLARAKKLSENYWTPTTDREGNKFLNYDYSYNNSIDATEVINSKFIYTTEIYQGFQTDKGISKKDETLSHAKNLRKNYWTSTTDHEDNEFLNEGYPYDKSTASTFRHSMPDNFMKVEKQYDIRGHDVLTSQEISTLVPSQTFEASYDKYRSSTPKYYLNISDSPNAKKISPSIISNHNSTLPSNLNFAASHHVTTSPKLGNQIKASVLDTIIDRQNVSTNLSNENNSTEKHFTSTNFHSIRTSINSSENPLFINAISRHSHNIPLKITHENDLEKNGKPEANVFKRNFTKPISYQLENFTPLIQKSESPTTANSLDYSLPPIVDNKPTETQVDNKPTETQSFVKKHQNENFEEISGKNLSKNSFNNFVSRIFKDKAIPGKILNVNINKTDDLYLNKTNDSGVMNEPPDQPIEIEQNDEPVDMTTHMTDKLFSTTTGKSKFSGKGMISTDSDLTTNTKNPTSRNKISSTTEEDGVLKVTDEIPEDTTLDPFVTDFPEPRRCTGSRLEYKEMFVGTTIFPFYYEKIPTNQTKDGYPVYQYKLKFRSPTTTRKTILHTIFPPRKVMADEPDITNLENRSDENLSKPTREPNLGFSKNLLTNGDQRKINLDIKSTETDIFIKNNSSIEKLQRDKHQIFAPYSKNETTILSDTANLNDSFSYGKSITPAYVNRRKQIPIGIEKSNITEFKLETNSSQFLSNMTRENTKLTVENIFKKKDRNWPEIFKTKHHTPFPRKIEIYVTTPRPHENDIYGPHSFPNITLKVSHILVPKESKKQYDMQNISMQFHKGNIPNVTSTMYFFEKINTTSLNESYHLGHISQINNINITDQTPILEMDLVSNSTDKYFPNAEIKPPYFEVENQTEYNISAAYIDTDHDYNDQNVQINFHTILDTYGNYTNETVEGHSWVTSPIIAVNNETNSSNVTKKDKTTTPSEDPDDYYASYMEYTDSNNTEYNNASSFEDSVFPNPDLPVQKPSFETEPELVGMAISDSNLLDNDLHDHDVIDSIMYIYFGNPSQGQRGAGRQIIIVGAVIALVAQFLTLASGVRRVRTHRGEEPTAILLNIEISLTATNLVFILGVQATSNDKVCKGIAVILYYLHLSTMFWFVISSMHALQCLRQIKYPVKFQTYCLLGWTIPILLVIAGYIFNDRSYETNVYCWISPHRGVLFSYILPVLWHCAVSVAISIFGLRDHYMTDGKEETEDEYSPMKILRINAIALPLLAVIWFTGMVSLENSTSLLFSLIFLISDTILNWLLFACWLPSEASQWRDIEEDYYEDEEEYEDESSMAIKPKRDDLVLLSEMYEYGSQGQLYNLRTEPISIISGPS